MPDKDKNEKNKQIGNIDVNKARKIILDTIGSEEKKSSFAKALEDKKVKTDKDVESPTPLFFGKKKFPKMEKPKITMSGKEKGAKEISDISGTEERVPEGADPLFFKGKKLDMRKKELSQSEKAKGVQEVKQMSGKEKKPREDSQTPLFLKKKEDIKPKKITPAPKVKKITRSKQAKTSRRLTALAGGQEQKVPPDKKAAQEKFAQAIPIKKLSPVLSFAKPAVNTMAYTFVISILIFIIFYSLFIISVTQFDIDNKAARYAAKYLPVPAVITKNGIIEYYDFKDALDKDIRELFQSGNIESAESLKVWKLID